MSDKQFAQRQFAEVTHLTQDLEALTRTILETQPDDVLEHIKCWAEAEKSKRQEIPAEIKELNEKFGIGWDYIVCGAGSCGSIVAHTLATKMPDKTVLLVEYGQEVPNNKQYEYVWLPPQWTTIRSHEPLEWGYMSTPQENLIDPQTGKPGRRINLARAKATGGCALHNAMAYVRGGNLGYDNWSKNLGCAEWSAADNHPWFEELEKIIPITVPPWGNDTNPFCVALQAAGNDQGYCSVDNYNVFYNNPETGTENDKKPCTSALQFLIDPKTGERVTTYSALLGASHEKAPSNLTIVSGYMVTNVTFNEDKKANGIVLSGSKLGWRLPFAANKEVIIAGGAINSPQLLQLSGVGPADLLRKLDIPVVSDLKGVGENFMDDLFVLTAWKAKQEMPKDCLKYGIMGAVVFTNTSKAGEQNLGTDIEMTLTSGYMEGLPPDTYKNSYWINPNCQLLESRGTVSIVSKNAFDLAVIDPKFLSAESDMERILEGTKQALALGVAPGLQEDWAGDRLTPTDTSDEGLTKYIKETLDTCFHYAGTCKMGDPSKDDVVVDTHCNVKGVTGLRVIDASVIPKAVSGNTAGACMMIALRTASMIAEGKW